MNNQTIFQAANKKTIEEGYLNNRLLIIVTISVFILSTLIRIYFSAFNKSIFVYPDELRYLDIARSLFTDGSIMIRNVLVDFQKILYPLAIAPTNMIADVSNQIVVINILNCLYMSSSVFPVYLIAKRIMKKNWAVILSIIFVVALPDMIYSITIMSENIYYPLVLWTMYFVWRAMDADKIKSGIIFAILGGTFSYLLYLTKEIALSFLLAYAVIILLDTITRKKLNNQKLIPFICFCAVFGVLFIAFKVTVFAGMGNSYDQMDIKALSTPYSWFYLVYSFVYTSLSVLIAFFYFPIVLPYFRFRELSEGEKTLYKYIIITLIIAIFTISYTISIREDLGRIAPRIHLRYLGPLSVPFFVLFLKIISDDSQQNVLGAKEYLNKIFIVTSVLIITILLMFKGVGLGSCVDQTFLVYISQLIKNKWLSSGINELSVNFVLIGIKIMIISGVIIGTILLIKVKAKNTVILFIVVIMSLNLFNNYASMNTFKEKYIIPEKQVVEMEDLNNRIKNMHANVLIVFDSDVTIIGNARLLDTYITSPAYYITHKYLLKGMNGKSTVALRDIDYNDYLVYTVKHNTQRIPDTIDYIISATDKIAYKNVELILYLPNSNLYMYKNLMNSSISAYYK